MKKPIVEVTDHALVRYLDRVMKIDVEAHRREIGRKVDRAAELGASAVIIDGQRYILKEGRVITISPRHMNFGPNISAWGEDE